MPCLMAVACASCAPSTRPKRPRPPGHRNYRSRKRSRCRRASKMASWCCCGGVRRPSEPQSIEIAHRVGVEHEEPAVRVQQLVKRFGAFIAVDHVSFEVERGEIFGLLGPNGAGKTTTFRMLCGLLPPSGGQLHVAGADVRTASASARARLGYVAQKFSLYGRSRCSRTSSSSRARMGCAASDDASASTGPCGSSICWSAPRA